MLSIGAMGSGQGAYYVDLAREDYYQKGGEPLGVWFGQGAQDLGLTGSVHDGSLSRLFEGFHPLDNTPLIQNAGASDHQPGWDLTFSAPKSVSVLWSQANPDVRKTIQEAHHASVRAGLEYFQDTSAFTRRGKGGAIREPGRLIVATFEHGTSRAQDPQLHTHALVMNVCTRSDGTTGTIESKPLYLAKMTAGAIYRAEFAWQLGSRLDLGIRRNGSCFEVEGVPKRVMDEFSKRASEIRAVLHERGHDSAASAAVAALSTRQVKGHIARSELFSQWHSASDTLGWGPKEADEFLRNTRAPFHEPMTEQSNSIEEALQRATEQQSYFSTREFVRYVAEEAQGRGFGAATVRRITDTFLKDSLEITRLGLHNKETVFTTREMMELEHKLIQRFDHSKSHAGLGVSTNILDAMLHSRDALSDEQRAACRHACGSGAGTIRVITGMAGTGKTTMLSTARLSWELAGFRVYGAALSGKAAKGLSEGAGIRSETLHRTLTDIERGRLELGSKDVLVVDEAGMIGTRMMERLTAHTERTGARLVLVGDSKQLQPIDAGGPFAEAERRLGSASLTEVRRQRDQWARDTVHDFAAGRARKGLEAFAERGLLSVGNDRRSAYDQLIASWKTHGVQAPEEQLIFTGTRFDAAILNRMAQATRISAGVLNYDSIRSADGGDTFHIGDRILFTKKSRMYGVENGSVGDVVSFDTKNRHLSARLDSGELVSISLDEYSHVRLGYAVTTHKGQGATVERAYVLAGGSMQDREITYVQTSRARGETRIFADRETAGDSVTQLAQKMSVSRAKVMAHTIQEKNVVQDRQHDFGIDF